MERSEIESAFFDDLKKIMIKHRVSALMVGDGQGMICSLPKDNYFSFEEASVFIELA